MHDTFFQKGRMRTVLVYDYLYVGICKKVKRSYRIPISRQHQCNYNEDKSAVKHSKSLNNYL